MTRTQTRNGNDRTRHRLLGRAAVVAVVGMIAAGGAACADSAGPETGADVQDVAFTPFEFVGEEVTLSAEVLDDAPGDAFFLGADEIGGSAILVINNSGTQVEEDQVVQVTGTVRLLEMQAFEEEGLFDENVGFDGDVGVFEPFEDRPVVIAERIDFFVPDENE